jgi:hypothetical protein
MRPIAIVLLFDLLSFLCIPVVASDSFGHSAAVQRLGTMPVAFTRNMGQWPDSILFRASAGETTMWFLRDGIYYQFTRRIAKPPIGDAALAASFGPRLSDMPDKFDRERDSIETTMTKAEFVGASNSVQVIAIGEQDYKCNYFIGNDPARWHADVPNYSGISLKGLYSGVDVTFRGAGGRLEYEITGVSQAAVNQVQIVYRGADSVARQTDGISLVRTRFGERQFVGIIPAGQNSSATRESATATSPSSGTSLVYSTYLGGGNADEAQAIAVDGSGNAYVTGHTWSTNFPTQNPYQTDPGDGRFDVFVTKLSASGSSLVYSTYLGGTSDEIGQDIAVDGSGNAYVTGWTWSTNFPTQNPYQTRQGGDDVFVTKLSASGSSIVYSTYLGGSGGEPGDGIAVDDSGNAYVTGLTNSTDFPTQSPYQTYQGGSDVFVSKLSASGSSLVYSTYLGGTSRDNGYDIAVDDSGNAYVTGLTYSTDFPTQSPYQTDQDSADVFVAKLSASGSSLVYSTYLGGNGVDIGDGVAVDGSGNAYVTGLTYSTDFPTQSPYQTDQDSADVFVAKLSASGSSLVYSTYLGGSYTDCGYSIAVDGSGNAYVTGGTHSTNFPTQNPYQTDPDAGAFVTKLSATGNSLLYSTYLGGEGSEVGTGIAVDGSGNAYVTGWTASYDFPTQSPYQTYQGGNDIFVTKLNSIAVPTLITKSPQPNTPAFPVTANVLATFSTGMNMATFVDSNVIVSGDIHGRYIGATSYNPSANMLTFNPTVSFGYGERVTVTLADGIVSSEGALLFPTSWSFTTEVTGGARQFATDSVYNMVGKPNGPTLADLNRDGLLDVFTPLETQDNVAVRLNLGAGVLGPPILYAAGDNPTRGVAADLNSDGFLDIIVANYYSNDISVLLNNGSGSFLPQQRYTTGSLPLAVSAGDWDNDGDIDIAVACEGTSATSLLFNNGTGQLSAPVAVTTPSAPKRIACGDVDLDGDIDLAVVGKGSGSNWWVGVLLNNGDGTFAAQTTYSVAVNPYDVQLIDVNGDRNLDLVTASRDANCISVLLNNGSGGFGARTDYATGQWPLAVTSGDLDHDGDLDLVSSNSGSTTLTVLLNNGAGVFTRSDSLQSGTFPFAVVAGDIDNDGDLDLISTARDSDQLFVFTNRHSLCCVALTGNVNSAGIVDLGDLSALVSYLTGGGYVLPCPDAANVNGTGIVDLGDLSALVSYLTGGGYVLPNCP